MKATAPSAKKPRPAGQNWTLQDSAGWTVASAPPLHHAVKWSKLLGNNATLPPRLKHAVDAALQVSLRAEIREDEPRDILHHAMGEPIPPCEPAPAATMDDLVLLCRESGWEPTVRPKSGLVLVPLDGASPARLIAEDGGGLRCVVELPTGDAATTVIREARALLLLRLCNEVRLVRAQHRMDGGTPTAELEVTFPTMPPPELLGHGLSALQTALRTAAAEFEALGDETLASEFLATMRCVPSGPHQSQSQNQT